MRRCLNCTNLVRVEYPGFGDHWICRADGPIDVCVARTDLKCDRWALDESYDPSVEKYWVDKREKLRPKPAWNEKK